MSRSSVDSPELRCPRCASRHIRFERDAILLARVAELRGGVLVLDGPTVPQPLDGARLLCAECGTELPGAEWSAERPRHVPRGQQPITDADALDRLAAHPNAAGDWNGAELCELAVDLLRCTGRHVEHGPYPEHHPS